MIFLFDSNVIVYIMSAMSAFILSGGGKMGKISILVIFVFTLVIAPCFAFWTEEKEATKRTVWEFKSSKVVIQVFVKKKPWSSEDAEVLSNLLGFEVTTKTWYYAVIKNLQKDIEIYYEPSDFRVILKDRKQAEGRRLSFNSAPFVDYSVQNLVEILKDDIYIPDIPFALMGALLYNAAPAYDSPLGIVP